MLRRCRYPLDALLSFLVVGITILRMAFFRRRTLANSCGLVVLDSAYTLDEINARDLYWSISGRDCDGLFGHVWSVHPLVGANEDPPGGSSLRLRELSPSHTFVEAHTSVGKRWSAFPLTAFALSQRQLLAYLRRLIVSGRVSAIRVGDPYYLGLLGYLLIRRTNLAFAIRINCDYDTLFEATGLPVYPRLLRFRRVEKWIDRFVLRRVELVFAPTSRYRDFAVANGSRAKSCVIVPFSGLLHPAHFSEPDSRSNVRKSLDVDDVPLLVAVTRLEPVKRVVDLVDVLARVRQQIPDAVCVVAGDGSQWDEVLGKAQEYGLSESLRLLGSRAQPWIASLLTDADVILAPMMGRALVEAALSGTPVVAYDVDWHRELLSDRKTGMLVPAGDYDAMAEAVVELLSEPELSNNIALRARQEAAEASSREATNRSERAAWIRVLPVPPVGDGPL